jgi:ferrous iron transport protein B
LSFEGYEIRVIDLPGIYSFSTFSMEEIVSRNYVALEEPDAVINPGFPKHITTPTNKK